MDRTEAGWTAAEWEQDADRYEAKAASLDRGGTGRDFREATLTDANNMANACRDIAKRLREMGNG